MFKKRSSASRFFEVSIQRINNALAYLSSHRLLLTAIATTCALVIMLAFVSVRGNMNGNQPDGNNQHAKSISGNSVTTTFNSASDLKNLVSGSSAATKIIVNGQQITVPENGSVSKTYTDENGTTHVNVENHSSDSGNSSSVSTITNINTTTPSTTTH